MSATRDKNQKITFVYSNLYSIYRKGVERAREGAVECASEAHTSLAAEALTELATGRYRPSSAVIKAGERAPGLRTEITTPPKVTPYTPAELLGKRIARPTALPAKQQQSTPTPVESLKQNLKSLSDLQARLRFMLKKLEDLIKE